MTSRRKAPDQVLYGEIDTPTHEGWLLKEDKAEWKKRFVVLKEKKMYCYQERKEGSLPKGVIDINGYMIELVDDQDLVNKLIQSDELAVFQLMHPLNPEEFPPSRFCASNEKNLQEWFNSILLEFCREYVRRSTYVDLAALDEDVPDFAAFQAKKKLAQIAEAANEEHNYYQELELDEEGYEKFQQQRDSAILEENAQKEEPLAVSKKAPEPAKVLEVKPDEPPPKEPLGSPRGNQPPPQKQPETTKQQKRTTKVLQNASAWGQAAHEDDGPKESKKSAVAEEIERERQRLKDEEGRNKGAEDQKKRDEQAAAKKAADEEAARKAKEESAAAQKKKLDEEAASKKRAEDEAAAKKKKAEDEAALQRKNKEDEEQLAKEKKAAEEAAKKKKQEEEEERKRKEAAEKPQAAAAASPPASEAPAGAQTPAQKKEARKTVAQLEIEQERERQKREEDNRASKVPDLPPRQAPPTLQSATAAFGGSAKRVSAVPQAAPAAATPALPARAERGDSQKPFTTMEHNRITVVTARPKVNTSVAAGGAAPQRLFSGKHTTLKDAAIDWINSRLGQDASLQSRGLVPVSSANLASKCKDGVLLCKLVNTAVSKTLDDRAINYDGLSDQSNVKENFSLCLNSGRAIGCNFTVQPDTLLKGNEDDFVSTIAQFIVVYLRSRLKIMYDGDDVNLRCGVCSSTVDSQYAMKGSSPCCMNCISKPLTLINLFCGEGGMSGTTPITSSPQVRSQAQTQALLQAQVVDAKTQPDYQEVSKQLDSIGDRFSKLTDKDIVDGKGSQLLTDMKALMAKLQAISVKYPMESYALVQRYNTLTKEIPERINKGYKNAGDNQVVVTSSGQKCFKCQKNLTGQTVEVFGHTYHQDCFGCFECGKSLGKSCLNVDNKPYCERCGKKAFIQSRLRK